MKLDAEDYENIYLRLKARLWKLVIAVGAIVGITSFTAGLSVVKTSTRSAVDEYVKTEYFQQEVVKAATERLAHLQAQSNSIAVELNRQESAVARLADLPLYVGPHGLQAVGKDGRKFSIEMGEASPGSGVQFTSTFESKPIVFLFSSDARSELPRRGTLESATVEIRALETGRVDGFVMPKALGPYVPSKYRWVAFGA